MFVIVKKNITHPQLVYLTVFVEISSFKHVVSFGFRGTKSASSEPLSQEVVSVSDLLCPG